MSELNSLSISLLQWGDDALVLGQRTAEWCGHGPVLEEDIALTNIALDLIGQARNWLTAAGARMEPVQTEDDLAYFRTDRQFHNHKLLELPNGDFGDTICRIFLWSQFSLLRLEALAAQAICSDSAAIAAKALKEVRYHLSHTADWMVRLGDGTAESHERIQASLDRLMPYTGELFHAAAADEPAIEAGVLPDPSELYDLWETGVAEVLEQAGLSWPDCEAPHRGGKDGLHTEHLGYVLAEMQSLARTYPGVTW